MTEKKHAEERLNNTQKAKAVAEETKATADEDLAQCTKVLVKDIAYIEKIHHKGMTRATEFEESGNSRAAELEALVTAKKIITEATEGDNEIVYGDDAAADAH